MRTARNPRRTTVRNRSRGMGREMLEELEVRRLLTMTFKITYDATTLALPNINTIQSAVNFVTQQFRVGFSNTMTVNINIKAGTGTATLASTTPAYVTSSYSAYAGALSLHNTTPERATAVANLPLSDPYAPGDTFKMTTAEAKALGLRAAASTASDGTITLGSSTLFTFNANQRASAGKIDFIGVMEREVSQILGRTFSLGIGAAPTYNPYDVYRFVSSGLRSQSTPDSGAYFSIDNGVTPLGLFTDSDDSNNWLLQNPDVPDAFNSSPQLNTKNDLTEADRVVMDILGYNRTDVQLLPDSLIIASQPTNSVVGTILAPSFIVEAVDVNGVLVPINSSIDVLIYNGAVSFDSSSVTTVQAVNGIATFDNLTIANAGTGIQLIALDSTDNIESGPSLPFGAFTTDTYLATHTTMSTANNPITYGEAATFSVTVTAAGVNPIGSVDITDNGQLVGNWPLDPLGHAFFTYAPTSAGVHGVVATFGGSIGFNGSASAIYTETVNKAGINVVGITASDKVYDGSTNAILDTTLAVPSGAINGDTVNVVTTNATGSFAKKSLGAGIVVTVNGLTLSGAGAGNYTIITPTTSASITARPLSTVVVTVANKLFDGTTNATILTRTLNGVLPGDTAIAIGGTATFANAAVGNNKVVSVTGLTLTGAAASNYIINPSATTTASILNATPPAAPSGLASTALSGSSIRTTWTLNGNSETGVLVARFTPNGWQFIASLPAGSTSYTETNLAGNTAYYYDVVTFNSFGTTWANTYSGATTPALAAPSAPTGVSATALSSVAVRVNWTLNGGTEGSVTVVRWNGVVWVPIATLAAGSTSYVDSTLSPLTTAHYNVIAANAAGQTYAAVYATATTFAAPTAAPAAPTGLSTTVLTPTSVRVNWTLHGGGETVVYVLKWNGAAFQYIAALAAGSNTFTDNSAAQGANLYLIATANNLGTTFAANYATATI